jgi:hypothetical protein
MSSPLQFVSLGRARRGRRTQRGWNYHKDTENTEFRFKKLKNSGFLAAFMKFGRSAATGFNVMALPVRHSNPRKSDFALLDQTETAPYYEYIISSSEA